MKKVLLPLFLAFILAVPLISFADGYPEDLRPTRKRAYRAPVEESPLPTPEPSCVATSSLPKIQVISLNAKIKAKKFLGEIKECVTTQWEVMKLLAGPNTIGLTYPEEKEMWGYLWMWRYDLKNPIGETLILMDKPGKRIMKGKNPVELYITFNENDVVEGIKMVLVKKKNSQY